MYDWLQEQGLKRIGLVGAGHGAHLAAIASGLRRVRWLVLRAPALCPDREGRPRKDEPAGAVDVRNDTQRMHAPEDSEALAACARFEGHALIVESGRDEVIPHAAITSYEQAFPRAASMTRETLDGADHELSEPRHRLAFAKKLGDWLRATSRDSTGACPDESVVA